MSEDIILDCEGSPDDMERCSFTRHGHFMSAGEFANFLTFNVQAQN